MRQITLRLAEITLLRRALLIYARKYQDLMVASKEKWEKEDLAKMIKASDNLSERLLLETVPTKHDNP